MLNILYNAETSGSVSIVQTVPSFINGVISMLVGVFFPVITYKIAQEDIKGAVEQIINAQRIIAIVGCAVITVFSGMATEFFMLWVPKENAVELSKLSFITIFPHLIISCTWILNNLNIAMNKVKIPALFTLLIGIINIILALVVVKLFNITYVCIPILSSFLQIIWTGVFLPLYSAKVLNVDMKTFYPPVVKALIASGICFLITIFIKSFFAINNWLSFIVIGGSIGLVSLIIFGLFELGLHKFKEEIRIIFNRIIKNN